MIISKIEEKFGKNRLTRGKDYDFLDINVYFPSNRLVFMSIESHLKGEIIDFNEK